jgi:hypothetical protein
MLAIFKVPLPVLLRVKLSGELLVAAGWLEKVKLVGERPAIGAVPVPIKLTVCGLFVAVSETVNVAVRLPGAVGLNFTLIVQVPFNATEPPHVLVSVKSAGSAPVTEMLMMVKLAFPVLVRVMP